ncbi:PTPLA-domain-containing protein [Gloeophyllum trabeum ATCC 11539]|uniref:Very-long-chain (3R)-3-hydroxyacyl-CoA dehydratase n=1 Tax=Gloeophyllum trabeum (strain ATCC 11539 / FP-39264 / Madison 617) TaxID=670483 RepID=S7RUU0_GLOTA|nr:PTPLA-domain-containing protein [Gloeophyllum trabeum ATCC 11539]EPQ56974.1 PTPLA-domain-containing protein [Gloeophyllum trabeum ATCC 11539]
MAPPTRSTSAAKKQNNAFAFPATESTQSPVLYAYMTLYNVLSAVGWSLVLYTTVSHLLTSPYPSTPSAVPTAPKTSSYFARLFSSLPILKSAAPAAPPTSTIEAFVLAKLPFLEPYLRRSHTLYQSAGLVTAVVQSFAVLEVVHVLLGWVKSALPTTAVQVASRLILVWGIAERFEEARTSPFYATMLLSWASTEIIRYSYYALSLLSSPTSPAPFKVTIPYWLTYLRYTTFYVLYPTGAGSEAFCMYATLPKSNPISGAWVQQMLWGRWGVEDWVRAALFVIWWPGLYVMYTHMMRQRRKVLGTGGQKLGAAPAVPPKNKTQ